MPNILIIGAGASGLMAARELCKHGAHVTVLEARNRIGGRIHTIYDAHAASTIELGAEFVHGNLPVTFELLEQAKLVVRDTHGQPFQSEGKEIKPASWYTPGWELLEEKLNTLGQDMTLLTFLNKYFREKEFGSLRERAISFASGYDAADPARVSVFALRDEWMNDEAEPQYRIKGGYGKLMNFLEEGIKNNGGKIHLADVVKEIHWQHEKVKLVIASGKIFNGDKVIITIPLGVLQQSISSESAIEFTPEIPVAITAANNIGYGAVLKVLLLFKKSFWNERGIRNMGFIFSNEKIPTWWTQLPDETPLLTGWLAGPNAYEFLNSSDASILNVALQSLTSIFGMSENNLRELLLSYHVANWTTEVFTKGAYSYATVETSRAREVLKQSIDGTIYFAGEALYEGKVMGTVEAALMSGLEVAKAIMK